MEWWIIGIAVVLIVALIIWKMKNNYKSNIIHGETEGGFINFLKKCCEKS